MGVLNTCPPPSPLTHTQCKPTNGVRNLKAALITAPFISKEVFLKVLMILNVPSPSTAFVNVNKKSAQFLKAGTES